MSRTETVIVLSLLAVFAFLTLMGCVFPKRYTQKQMQNNYQLGYLQCAKEVKTLIRQKIYELDQEDDSR